MQEFRESDGVDAFNSANDFLELCFKFIELKLDCVLPRKKEELTLYLKKNYNQLIR